MAVKQVQIDLSTRQHPYYQDHVDEWEDCYLAYKGGKEFIEAVIERHQLEFDEDFAVRRERAFYLNFVKRIVNAMTDIIFDNIIVRPDENKYPVLKPFYKKASYFGETFDMFIRRASKMSSVFGWVVCAVEFYTTRTPSLADVEEGKAYPRLRMFTPLQFVDWSRDGDKFNYGLVSRRVYVKDDPKDPLSDIVEVDEYTIYTDKTVEVVRDGVVVASYKHNLGHAPLILINDGTVDEFGFSEPLIKDASRIAATLVNWLSVLDEVFERQALSQLVCPDDGSLYEQAAAEMEQSSPDIPLTLGSVDDYTRQVLKKVGTSKIFTYPANSGHPPQYISPPASDMRIGWQIIMELAQIMFFLVGLGGVREDLFTSSSKARESTLSLMQSYLKDKAANLQAAEEEIFALYFSYMPEAARPDVIEVRYPAEIDAGPFAEFFSAMIQSLVKPNISPSFNKAILKRLVDKCPYLTTEEKETIKKEINNGKGLLKIPK